MIAFIWGHSLMPGEISSDESGFITNLLHELLHISEEGLEGYVRKSAHFIEFLILGVLVSADSRLLLKRIFTPLSIVVGLLVPMIDETIQLFVLGRSGSLLDVWLDFSGFVTGIICSVIIYRVIKE